MAICRWRQIRIWNVEKSILDNAITAQEGEVAGSSNFARAGRAFADLSKPASPLAHIARHETRYDRQYTRSLNRLVFLRGQKLLNLPNEPTSGINILDVPRGDVQMW